ncbi:hypothetical protein V6R86_06760 [Sphingomonas kaistensis]|uniref:Transposase n=1 Tax=Sphingomonas kaistensis TaxID=298708 RepID=A0ABZ2G3Q7_9SPHN
MLSLARQGIPETLERPERQNSVTAAMAKPSKSERKPSASSNWPNVRCCGRFFNRFEREFAQVVVVESSHNAAENV